MASKVRAARLRSMVFSLEMGSRPAGIAAMRAAYLATRICVMQARPGRIIEDSVVPFARPRTIDVSFEPEFVSLTQRLRERIVAARAVKEVQS